MKILVTGANGFLGKELILALKEKNLKIISTDIVGNVDIVGDLSNKKFVDSLPLVDVVVNCAAVQYVTKNIPFFCRKKFFYKNNIESAKNLSEKYKDINIFVHIGTSMMYRQTGQNIYYTDSEMLADGIYSKSKLEAQKYINNINNQATVIPCIIGGQGREGLFKNFVGLIKKYSLVVYPGKGEHKIHMVHVKDVASLIFKIIETKSKGFFNAAAPEPLSIKEWVDNMQEEMNIKKVRHFKIPLLPIGLLSKLLFYRLLAREQLLMLKFSHVLDISKSLEIGWKPQFNNAQIAKDITKNLIKGEKKCLKN